MWDGFRLNTAGGNGNRTRMQLAQVTVEESLMFSAQLRLMGVSRPDLRTFVNEARPRCLFWLLAPQTL